MSKAIKKILLVLAELAAVFALVMLFDQIGKYLSVPEISYQLYTQNAGWTEWISDGNTAGEESRESQIGSISIKLDAEINGGVSYRTMSEGEDDWQEWMKDGEISGLAFENKSIESVQMELTGKIAKRYDIYYRVYSGKLGWLGWAKNGESAGTFGNASACDAIQIRLVHKKSEEPPVNGDITEAYVEITVPQNPKDPGTKVIYLTFEDGPGPYTQQILDTLEAYDVRATFFVTALNPEYESLIAAEADGGHTVGVHTYSHNYNQVYSDEDAFLEDFNRMNEIIYQQTGEYAHYFRFLGTSNNKQSRSINRGIMTRLTKSMTDAGYEYVDWSVSSEDYYGDLSASAIIDTVTSRIASRDISVVIMHDSYASSADAVESIVQWGLENGYTFRAVDEAAPETHLTIRN